MRERMAVVVGVALMLAAITAAALLSPRWVGWLVGLLLVGAGVLVWRLLTRPADGAEPDLGTMVRRRTAELEQAAVLTREITTGLVLDDVLGGVFESFRTVLPYNRLGCSLLSDDGRTVRAAWTRSDGKASGISAGYELPIVETSLGEVLESGRPRIINDLLAYLDRHPESRSTGRMIREGMRSSLTFPLIASGRPLGFLFFSSRSPGTYSESHTKVFGLIAETLARVVEKSMLYEELLATRERLEAANRKLGRLARLDGLTGLDNRRSFDERIDLELRRAGRTPGPLSLLMIDIDRFKDFNDRFGHPAGDHCLKVVADVLRLGLRRAGDFLARFGGEEFVAILPATDAEEAAVVAARLRAAVAETEIDLEGIAQSEMVTVSIGGVTADTPATSSAADLVAAADEALYEAKAAGRNTCRFSTVATGVPSPARRRSADIHTG